MQHWYIGSFFTISGQALSFLEILDRRLAFKITLRYWLKPLYQDYTALGYVLGFILRTGRIIGGGLVYAVVILAAAMIYLTWATVPLYIIYRVF